MVPSRLENLRNLRTANADSAFATAFVTLTSGAFLVGFIQLLGGSDLWIGLLTAVPSLVGLLQIPGAIWGRSFPTFKRFVTPGGLIWRLLYVPLIFLPFVSWSNGLRLLVLAILITVANAVTNIVNPIYNDWLAEMVPGESRGWFFARRNAIGTAVGAIIGILGAVVLDALRARNQALAFSLVFAIAVVCAAISEFFYLRMTELERRNPVRQNLMQGIRAIWTPFGDREYRKVLIYLGIATIGQTLGGNLFPAFGRESLHLNFKVLQGTAVGMAVGNVASAALWGFLSDKVGNKPVLVILGFALAICPLPWILCVPGQDTFDTVLLLCTHVLMGVIWCGINLCQFNIMLATAEPEDRANYLGAGLTVLAVVGGLAPLAGGAYMALLRDFHTPEVAYKLVFATVMLLRFLSVFTLLPAREAGSSGVRSTLRDLSGVTPRGMRVMRSLTRTGDAASREEAIASVGEDRISLASDEILKALHDPLPRVRRQAAAAIAELRDPRAVGELIHQLEEHPDLVEEEAVQSLGALGDPRAVPSLVRLLESPRSLLRRAAARALGRIGATTPVEDEALRALTRAAADEHDPDLRRAALQAFRLMESRAADEVIASAANDPLPSVRIAAAEAIADLEIGLAAPALRHALASYRDEATAEVAYALGAVGGPEDIPAILGEAERSVSMITRRRCLLGVARLLGTEREAYRLLLMEGMARDTELMELLGPAGRRSPAVRAALQAHATGDEAGALRAAARVRPEAAPLIDHPVAEAFLVVAPLLAEIRKGRA